MQQDIQAATAPFAGMDCFQHMRRGLSDMLINPEGPDMTAKAHAQRLAICTGSGIF